MNSLFIKYFEIIKEAPAGVHAKTPTGKQFFASWKDTQDDQFSKETRSAHAIYWPQRWFQIKSLIPEGPFQFKDSSTGYINGWPVGDIGDIPWLTKLDLLQVGQVQDLTADKLVESLIKSKLTTFPKVLVGLGIRGVNREWSKRLASKYRNIWNLGMEPWEKLILVPGIGATLGSHIQEFFHSETNWIVVDKLRRAGLDSLDGYIRGNSDIFPDETTMRFPDYIQACREWTPQVEREEEDLINQLEGKTFMFTGRLEIFTRKSAQEKVEDLGGIAGSVVNKETDFLVIGDKPGSKRFQAKLLEVPIIDEVTFLDMVKKAQEDM